MSRVRFRWLKAKSQCPATTWKSKLSFPFRCLLTWVMKLKLGLRFAVREGGKTVAAGVISKLLVNEESDKTLGFAKK